MVVLIILVFIIIAVVQVPKLRKTGRTRELVWFSIFMAMGLVLNIMLQTGVKLPNPVEIVVGFLDRIGLHY